MQRLDLLGLSYREEEEILSYVVDMKKKYQRKNTTDIIIFLAVYEYYKEKGDNVTFETIAKKLSMDKEIITKAIKFSKKKKIDLIEEPNIQSVICDIISTLHLNKDIKQKIENYYTLIDTTSNICKSTRPKTIIVSILYKLICQEKTFDITYYADQIEISVATLKRVIAKIEKYF